MIQNHFDKMDIDQHFDVRINVSIREHIEKTNPRK